MTQNPGSTNPLHGWFDNLFPWLLSLTRSPFVLLLQLSLSISPICVPNRSFVEGIMSCSSITLFCAVISILISISLSVSATEFIFNTNFTSTNILLFGNATVDSSVLILTRDSTFTIGRALYPSKIPIRFSDSSFSFATSFIFSVTPQPNHLPGHGFAFLFTPSTGINGTSSAQNLGLFNFTTNGNPNNHVFAIEFDSFQNQEFNDSNDNHVGVDLNSLESTASSTAGFWNEHGEFKELRINNGEIYQVWIECLNSLVNITMAELGMRKPRKPLISLSVNFSELLLDEMFVGFTASTGQLVQSHKILSWSFSTSNLSIGDALVRTNLPSFAPHNDSIFNSIAFIVGIIVGGSGLVIICCIVVYVLVIIKRRGTKKPMDDDIEDWELEYWPHRFAYDDVYAATDGFSEANVVGFGRNGMVYKGELGRSKVAVKKISVESECGMREFMAEISSLRRLKHRNLVKLIGWCKKEKGSLILMYEFMENGSLDKKLFECDENTTLSWEKRMKVLSDVATGLLYLHQGWDYKVIHSDIKANNVLLDRDMNARLGDFGLARMQPNKRTVDKKRVVGTVGYLAPEVVRTGRVSMQGDVFGFGVLVLEVVCGRRAMEEGKPLLVDWMRGVMERNEIVVAVDERLKVEEVGEEIDEMERMVCLGLLCAHPEAGARPTMQQVMNILGEINKDNSNHRTFEQIKTSSSSTSFVESDVLKSGR
ncbi:probable L-type lectin-domain containing receptor kinase VII.2 [Cucurbita moschata]|uniref:non-specific serine/threonine protein kinase n=1 Tax=Cucurbita moschata TaxID=3662 RepID=A0A6J1ERN0_CUCMO|nr:probable L-type lectin-domain containing receptor kinase VII.2 [Cucurbita moschata]